MQKHQHKKKKHRNSKKKKNLRSVPKLASTDSAQEEETSTASTDAKKSKPHSSQDHGKIALQDEERIARDAIGHKQQDEERIARDAIGHKQEQQADDGGDTVQQLLNMDDDAIKKQTSYYSKLLMDRFSHIYVDPNDADYLYDESVDQGDESVDYGVLRADYVEKCHQRLAIYRIRAYELSKGRHLAELDDAKLRRQYPPSVLRQRHYFKDYEKSLGWYFKDPKLVEWTAYDDYQRIVLRNPHEYLAGKGIYYTNNNRTYKEDLVYVQYYDAMANNIKWLKDYIRTPQWDKAAKVARLEALKIASGFRNVPIHLVTRIFWEYDWNIGYEYNCYKEFDGVYFEIWKRVAKLKMNFREALVEIRAQNMFPLRDWEIDRDLENRPLRFRYMKDNYDSCVAYIDGTVSEDDARQLIIEAVRKMNPKPKLYVDYARKKIAIAEDIGMISEGERLEFLQKLLVQKKEKKRSGRKDLPSNNL